MAKSQVLVAFMLVFYPLALRASDSGMPFIPTWPLAGSDADVQIFPDSAQNRRRANDENIQIISQIGAGGTTIENHINLTSSFGVDSFSGGANMTHPHPAPSGFNHYLHQADMAFMLTEMPQNDGSHALAVSRTNRRPPPDRMRFMDTTLDRNAALTGIEVDELVNEPGLEMRDQVRSWVVASGQTLREVLQAWSDREGWDLIWNTPREYPIVASAVFKGRYVDVSSALVRNFSRANPVPHARFYKGNRVLVISTIDGQ